MPKQPEASQRLFDNEIFCPTTYAVDRLLAEVVSVQLQEKGVKLPLSLEQKFARPEKQYVRDLVLRGYAGGFSTPRMWRFIGVDKQEGRKLHEKRKAQLQQLSSPYCFNKQAEQLIWRINEALAAKSLVVK